MRSSILKAGLIGGVVAGLIAPGFLVSSVNAQKQGAPLWYSVVSVNRVKKPDRTTTGKLQLNATSRVVDASVAFSKAFKRYSPGRSRREQGVSDRR